MRGAAHAVDAAVGLIDHLGQGRRHKIGELGPRLRSPSAPLSFQRACQTLTAWAEASSWRATSAW